MKPEPPVMSDVFVFTVFYRRLELEKYRILKPPENWSGGWCGFAYSKSLFPVRPVGKMVRFADQAGGAEQDVTNMQVGLTNYRLFCWTAKIESCRRHLCSAFGVSVRCVLR